LIENINIIILNIEKALPMNKLLSIASHFKLDSVPDQITFLGRGYINDSYILNTVSGVRYILQKKNSNIFHDVPGMMNNILKVTNYLRKAKATDGEDISRRTLTIMLSEDNLPYYISGEEYWIVCLFIENTITYQLVTDNRIAREGGRTIGYFQSLLADFNEELVDTLPGFHNMKHRFQQWDEVLAKDPVGRVKEVSKEIEWIELRKKEMLDFYSLIELGKIPSRVSHNDTKISNILFDADSNKALCLIDLDTVLRAPCLYDFGDAVRSYTNTGKEDDRDTENVSMSMDLYNALKEGYLSQANSFLTNIEKKYLPFSAAYITYEQVLQFLMDYINGDCYYKIESPDHNLIRTRAQYRLLLSIEDLLF